jgi:hypothetical protein
MWPPWAIAGGAAAAAATAAAAHGGHAPGQPWWKAPQGAAAKMCDKDTDGEASAGCWETRPW